MQATSVSWCLPCHFRTANYAEDGDDATMMNGYAHEAQGPDAPVRVGVAAFLGRFANRTLDVLLPPQCLRCGAMVDAPADVETEYLVACIS